MLQHWASEGRFYIHIYIGVFVFLAFIEPVRLVSNELMQYKTTYVEPTCLPNAVAFSGIMSTYKEVT